MRGTKGWKLAEPGPAQGSVYRSGEKNNTAERRGRNAGLGDSDRGTRREIASENIRKYEAGEGDLVVERGCSGKHPNKETGKITLDKDNNEENKSAYKTAKKEAKKSLAIAKASAYDRLYADMDTTEGQKNVLRMANEREKNSKVIKYEKERVLVDDLKFLERWREYYQKVVN